MCLSHLRCTRILVHPSSLFPPTNKYLPDNSQLSVSLHNGPHLCKKFKVCSFIVVLRDALIIFSSCTRLFHATHCRLSLRPSLHPSFCDAMLCCHCLPISPLHSHLTLMLLCSHPALTLGCDPLCLLLNFAIITGWQVTLFIFI